jgi:Ca-activated chloride channel homolog
MVSNGAARFGSFPHRASSVCLLLLFAAGAFAQSNTVSINPRAPRPAPQKSPSASIRLDVKAVQVPVLVTDIAGRPVQNLEPGDFELFEEGAQQQIASLLVDDAPVSIGVVFDASSSMVNKVAASADAVDQFFQTSVPGDEFSLVRFSDSPNYLSGFTSDIHDISARLHTIRASGWTALNDAIYLSIQKMRPAHNSRKALLVLSDGGDNNSRYSKRELQQLVREADVQVYSITFFEGSRLLESISTESGGRLVHVRGRGGLPDAIETISHAMRSQYLLSYYSSNPQNDGKYRRIRVSVKDPALRVSWRHGYYAPSD